MPCAVPRRDSFGFPGIADQLLDDGAVRVEALTEIRMNLRSHTLKQSPADYSLIQASRPLLEWRARERVRALPNVAIVDQCTVASLLVDETGNRVTGVRVERDGSEPQDLDADLVLSSLGRHGPINQWLTDLGFDPPQEEGVPINMMYASRYLRLASGSPNGDGEIVIGSDDPARGLALFAIEDGQHMLTLIGYGEDHPSTDEEGYWSFAASIAPPDVFEALMEAESLSEVATYRYQANLRRRYERLERFPAGLLVFGDSVCSFSPAFGQGMTMSALQAMALQKVLAESGDDLAKRYFAAASEATDDAWSITRVFDSAMPHVQAPWHLRAAGPFVLAALVAGERDARVARQISRIAGLLDRPSSIVRVTLAARIAFALGCALLGASTRVLARDTASEAPRFNPSPRTRAHDFHALTVSTVDRTTADSVVLTLEVPDDLRTDFTFKAGQHLTIRGEHDGQVIRRSYSLCDAPDSGRLRVAVKHTPGGAFSTYALKELVPGTTLQVSHPTGRFTPTLDPTSTRRYAGVAVGSGITPILSILTTTLQAEPHSTWTLHYGNRTVKSILFRTELETLQDEYGDRLEVIHYLSRQSTDGYRSGRVDPATLVGSDADQWFLCGPKDLVVGVASQLQGQGTDHAAVHVELFDSHTATKGPIDPNLPRSTVTLTGYGDDLAFEASQGEKILDVALLKREDLPYSCLSGSCGTCIAKVCDGEVAMDEAPFLALTQQERADDYVLACLTEPRSRQVTMKFTG